MQQQELELLFNKAYDEYNNSNYIDLNNEINIMEKINLIEKYSQSIMKFSNEISCCDEIVYYRMVQKSLMEYLKLNTEVKFNNFFKKYIINFNGVMNILVCDSNKILRNMFGNIYETSKKIIEHSKFDFNKYLKLKSLIIILSSRGEGDCTCCNDCFYELYFINFNQELYFHKSFFFPAYDDDKYENICYQYKLINDKNMNLNNQWIKIIDGYNKILDPKYDIFLSP